MGILSSLFGTRGVEKAPVKSVPQRSASKMMRMINAANTGRLESSWIATPTTVDALIYQHWGALVARSREQSENNDHATKFLSLCEINVAGPSGFTMKSQVKDPSGSPDLVAQKAVEDAFAEWSEVGNCDVTGTLSRADVEKLIVKTVAIDGEFIAVHRYGPEFPHGYALQIIDPVTLDPRHFEKMNNGNHIRHGIEFNANGKPVAYHFKEVEERQIGYVQAQKATQRIPAENVIHIFLPERVGQKRGLPWMRTALWRMKMLNGFEDAAITKARLGASSAGFFKNPDADPDDDDELPMEAGEPGQFYDIGNREFVQWDPQFPSNDFDPFVKAMLRSISSGLKVSYNNLASDLTSVNFSSIRQGALDEREMWKGLQEWLIGQWSKKVFMKWLSVALLNQKIVVPNRAGVLRPLPFDRLDKYKPVAFRGRRWAWIDPNSEMKATELGLGLKLISRTQAIEDLGRDPEDVWSEIEREEQMMAEMGIDSTMPADMRTPEPTAQDAGTTGE
jgi:lambda family phage portal protein